MLRTTLSALLALPLCLLPATVAAQTTGGGAEPSNLTGPPPRPDRPRRSIVRHPASLPQCQQGPIVIPPCPLNTMLVIFDAPVYDENGIFVICLKKVPFCVPEGLEPEG